MTTTGQKIVHRTIANAAKGICEAFYEDAVRDNTFYRMNPSKRRYVRVNWKEFIGIARHNLLAMLTMTKPNGEYVYSEHMREEIYEAMVIDGSCREAPQQAQASSLIH